jgi:starch synthase (maltosyl-transferring)
MRDTGRILIEAVYPELDSGRHPVKREVGDTLAVWADLVRDGHDVLAAVVKYRTAAEADWREAPMRHFDNDRWTGAFPLDENARYVYTIEAWTDRFASWTRDLERRVQAGQDVESELGEGAAQVREAASRAAGADKVALERAAAALDGPGPVGSRVRAALAAPLAGLMARWQARTHRSRYDRELEVVVDREAARFAAWYELFPRSQGRVPGGHGTWDDCIARLDDIRAMGFDVVYLPPIHPIGQTKRKGRNNALGPAPGDPGSPWAIGNAHGGHTAIEPALGTLADFRRFVEAARARGMEVALDYALQCSPDHPWVHEHPEWFYRRPDGTIRHAENPPKKYEDIVPLNFDTPDREALWRALADVLRFWIAQGVRTFRVDNPHTKPLPFWRWLIGTIQGEHPDVVFLSEAFTRPKLMRALAKLGFSQSYTYFTWRTTKPELTAYFTELCRTDVREYLRPNLFANTPDILTAYLQEGGRPAFKIRVALAAPLSALCGIYSGFELCENRAVPGTEEYQDSEKYEVRVRDWDAPGHIKPYIAKLNALRRAHPALQRSTTLEFHDADDEAVLFYGKTDVARGDAVLVAVTLDFRNPRECWLRLPLDALGIGPDEPYGVLDLLRDTEHAGEGPDYRVRLDPHDEPAFIFSIRRR